MDYDDRLDRATEREIRHRLDPMPAGIAAGVALVVKTTDQGAYPTVSPAVFACSIVDFTFDESEGANVSDSSSVGNYVYVYNVTSVVPPIGAVWIAVPGSGARYYMAYTGPKKT